MIVADSDSHTCGLPSDQLVHHWGKCYMIFSITSYLRQFHFWIPVFFCSYLCQTVTNGRISGNVVQIAKTTTYMKKIVEPWAL